jgi:adenine phosphoribosyltransferase
MKTRLHQAASLLRHCAHQGIEYFWDIEGITEDSDALQAVIDHLVEHCRDLKIDYVVGFDARGFLFGGAIAHALGAGFKQIRKKGKLPGPVVAVSYEYEYSAGTLELQDNGVLHRKRILLVDDVLATGGTARAGIELIAKVGGTVVEFVTVIEMPELGGRLKLIEVPIHSCISIIEQIPTAGVEYCVDMFVREEQNGQLILVKRLKTPQGYAMPGGRIESHETALRSAIRELGEEAGVSQMSLSPLCMLTGTGRDPRGPKVSVVFDCMAHVADLRGEIGATEVVLVAGLAELPIVADFVFDHSQFVRDHWAKIIAQEAQREPTL